MEDAWNVTTLIVKTIQIMMMTKAELKERMAAIKHADVSIVCPVCNTENILHGWDGPGKRDSRWKTKCKLKRMRSLQK